MSIVTGCQNIHLRDGLIEEHNSKSMRYGYQKYAASVVIGLERNNFNTISNVYTSLRCYMSQVFDTVSTRFGAVLMCDFKAYYSTEHYICRW